MVRTKFAQLPANIQKALATTSGLMLKEFDHSAENTKQTIRSNICFATNGGVNVSLKINYIDQGEGIDNCPKNTKELLDVDSAEGMISGTAVTVTADNIVENMGAADLTESDGGKEITPRLYIDETKDFHPKYYVVPYGKDGGYIEVQLDNGFSTGGLVINTEDKGKGQFPFEYKAFGSVDDPDVVPFRVFIKESETAPVQEVQATV